MKNKIEGLVLFGSEEDECANITNINYHFISYNSLPQSWINDGIVYIFDVAKQLFDNFSQVALLLKANQNMFSSFSKDQFRYFSI